MSCKMHPKILSALIWFCFCYLNTFAQLFQKYNSSDFIYIQKCDYFSDKDPQPDSLSKYSALALNEYSKSANSELTLISHYYFAIAHLESDTVIFQKHLILFSELCEILGLAEGKVYKVIALGTFARSNDKYDRAIQYFTQAIEILDKNADIDDLSKTSLRALIQSNLSSSYYRKNEYSQALKVAFEAEKNALLSIDTLRLIRAYQNMSAVYGDLSSENRKLGKAEDRARYRVLAEEKLLQVYEMSKVMNVDRVRSISAYNLGTFYSMSDNPGKGHKLLNEVIELTEKIKFKELQFSAFLVKSGIYNHYAKFDSSEYYALKAYTMAKKSGRRKLLTKSTNALSYIYLMQNKLGKARQMALQALQMAKDDKVKSRIRDSYLNLAEINEKSNNYKDALLYYRLEQEMRDSILSEDHLAQIEELNKKYQTELKDAQIKSLKNETIIQHLKIKQKNGLLVGLILLAVLTSFLIQFYYQKKTIKAQKNELNAKQALLRSQLNPHFLFNVLNAIQQFIYMKKDPEIVADLLAKFSRLTRRILNYTQQDFITLEDEINFLKDYMDLQRVRFDQPFEYSIDIDKNLDISEVLIPPMFTQAFVENSIEHGIMHKQEKGNISIRFKKEQDTLKVELEDNGIGREQSEFFKRNNEHRSLATSITIERLKILEKKFRRKAKLAIQDVINSQNLVTGTKVTLDLPFEEA